MVPLKPSCSKVHARYARVSTCVSRNAGPGIGMFCLKHDTVKRGKMSSKERVLQRWSSAVLSQLPAHLNTAAQSSQLTSCRRAQRDEKPILYQEMCTSSAINRRESGPLALFFLSLSIALFSPAPDYPCSGPTQDLRTADTLCSLLFVSLPLSSLVLPWAKHAYYVLLSTEVGCGSGKPVEGHCGFSANTFERLCCDLLTSTFGYVLASTFEKISVGFENLVKCAVHNPRVSYPSFLRRCTVRI